MKTSFYFALWILIYPLIDLVGNDAMREHSFVVALIAVFGLSWLINRFMPEMMSYGRAVEAVPILEDVYTRNVDAFKKRLKRLFVLETVISAYLLVSIIACLFVGSEGLITTVVFAVFAIGTIMRSVNLWKALSELKANPTSEQCMAIATEQLNLNYQSYYDERQCRAYSEMLEPKPRFYKLFSIFSIIVAAIVLLLGLRFVVSGLLIAVFGHSVGQGAFAGMLFLYGSLAMYFGVKDFVALWESIRITNKKKVNN